jgi:hypothetical protein
MLLGAAFLVAAAGGSALAKPAGVGLEWSWVPVIPFNGFGMKMTNEEFTLAWELSDAFEVGVFRGAGTYGGSYEYTDSIPGNNGITREISLTGNTAVSGIRLLTKMPALKFLTAGLEVGVMQIGAGTYAYNNSDGTAGSQADFGYGVPDPVGPPIVPVQAYNGETAALAGLVAKATLINAETKTVATKVAISGALRFVDLTDAFLLGRQETQSTSIPLKGIDEVTNYTNLALSLTIGLWF